MSLDRGRTQHAGRASRAETGGSTGPRPPDPRMTYHTRGERPTEARCRSNTSRPHPRKAHTPERSNPATEHASRSHLLQQAHQGLPGRHPSRRPARPDRAPGRDLRPARAQRRRQDDDRRHAHHARHPHQRQGVRRRHRRRAPPGGRQAGDRRGAADQHPRPRADRLGEPLLPRPLLRHEREQAARRGRRLLWSVPADRARQGAGDGALRRAWRSGSWWPGPSSTTPRSSSSTSRRPASTRRAASPCGRSSASFHADGPDHLPEHAQHGGGRPALRPHRHHGPRPDPRARTRRGAEGSRSAPTPS